MMSKRLKPSLATIEARLCGPSDGLLRRWLQGDSTLPADLVSYLESDPEATERRKHVEASVALEADDGLDATVPRTERPARPDLLLRFSESVRRRVAAASAHFGSEPAPGQIRTVERLCAPDGSTVPWDFPQPLSIVLRAQTSPGSPIWYAWIASPDVDYASYWDMVLEPRDEPCDPRAALIQAWNTVLVDTRGVGPAVGRLSSARLASLEALSNDFLDGPAVGHEWSAPGELIQRTVDGHIIVSGTPYGEPGSDPRLEYQSLYHAAADPVRSAAHAVLAVISLDVGEAATTTLNKVRETVRKAWTDGTGRLRGLVEDVLSGLLPPAPAPALLDDSHADHDLGRIEIPIAEQLEYIAGAQLPDAFRTARFVINVSSVATGRARRSLFLISIAGVDPHRTSAYFEVSLLSGGQRHGPEVLLIGTPAILSIEGEIRGPIALEWEVKD